MRYLPTILRALAWLLLGLITVLSVVPPEFRPETGAPHGLEHFAIFAAAGFAFGLGYSRKPAFIMVGLVVFAGAIELAQLVVPGRHARLADFIVDAAAICISAAVGSIVANWLFA